MTTEREIAGGLTKAQQSDLIKIGDPGNPFGGLFDALSAEDIIAFKRLGLIRSYVPAGCYAPLTKLTPKGSRVRAILATLKPKP